MKKLKKDKKTKKDRKEKKEKKDKSHKVSKHSFADIDKSKYNGSNKNIFGEDRDS